MSITTIAYDFDAGRFVISHPNCPTRHFLSRLMAENAMIIANVDKLKAIRFLRELIDADVQTARAVTEFLIDSSNRFAPNYHASQEAWDQASTVTTKHNHGNNEPEIKTTSHEQPNYDPSLRDIPF